MDKSTCRWPKCDRPSHTRGLCAKDYRRALRVSDLDEPWVTWDSRPPKVWPRKNSEFCEWPDCDRRSHVRSLCPTHYSRAVAVGSFDSPWEKWNPARPCAWCGKMFSRYQHEAQYCSRDCSSKSYADRHPESVRASTQRRRALRVGATVERFDTLDVRLVHGDICYLCGDLINFKLKHPNPLSPSLDHVIPLSRGGTHAIKNAAMTHLVCNLKKHVKDAPNLPQQTLLAI